MDSDGKEVGRGKRKSIHSREEPVALIHLAQIATEDDNDSGTVRESGSQTNLGHDNVSFHTSNVEMRNHPPNSQRLTRECPDVGFASAAVRNSLDNSATAGLLRVDPGTSNASSESYNARTAIAWGKSAAASSYDGCSTDIDPQAHHDAGKFHVGAVARSLDTAPVAEERAASSFNIREPNGSDVLLGRGRTHIDHPGNKMLQTLVGTHQSSYDTASRTEKTEITKNIVNEIQSRDGRFLKRDKGRQGWIEVSDEAARTKVSHSLRDGRKKPLGAADMQIIGGLDEPPNMDRKPAEQGLSLSEYSIPTAANVQGTETVPKRHSSAMLKSNDGLDDSKESSSSQRKEPSKRSR